MPTDREYIRLADKGHVGSMGLSDVEDAVNKLHTRAFTVAVPLDADGTVAQDLACFLTTHAVRVISAKLIPGGAVTADNTNYTTVSLVYNDGAGGAATTVAALTTQVASGNWVANQPKTLTVTAANAEVASGKLFAVDLTGTGAGVATPAFILHVTYQEI